MAALQHIALKILYMLVMYYAMKLVNYTKIPYVLESYYTALLNPINGNYENYTIGQEYGLYNDDYVIQTEPNQGFYAYSYKLASDQNYCDICINGYTGTVVDCNSENWWVNNGE